MSQPEPGHIVNAMWEAGSSGLVAAMHTGFTVADIERSIAFYRDVLGMTLVTQQEGRRPYLATITGFADVYVKMAYLKVTPEADHILELLEYTSHPAPATPRETNRPGNAHLCFRVADIHATPRAAGGAGRHLHLAPVAGDERRQHRRIRLLLARPGRVHHRTLPAAGRRRLTTARGDRTPPRADFPRSAGWAGLLPRRRPAPAVAAPRVGRTAPNAPRSDRPRSGRR